MLWTFFPCVRISRDVNFVEDRPFFYNPSTSLPILPQSPPPCVFHLFHLAIMPPHLLLLFPSRHLYLRQHLHLHHLTLFSKPPITRVFSHRPKKNPTNFPPVLPPWTVLTSPLLMILIIILLMSHLLFLMSYRLVHDIIFETTTLFVLKTSMIFLMWMLLLMSHPLIRKLLVFQNAS